MLTSWCFEMLVALVAALVPNWQHRQKTQAIEEKEEVLMEKEVAEALRFAAESEKDEVVSYFDPEDYKVTTPPDTVPSRFWKMNDETRRWVTVGHKPDGQNSQLKQIAEAEGQKKVSYFISVPGCFYEIEYGLVKGGGRE